MIDEHGNCKSCGAPDTGTTRCDYCGRFHPPSDRWARSANNVSREEGGNPHAGLWMSNMGTSWVTTGGGSFPPIVTAPIQTWHYGPKGIPSSTGPNAGLGYYRST